MDFPPTLPLRQAADEISSCRFAGIALVAYRKSITGGFYPEMLPVEGYRVGDYNALIVMPPPAALTVYNGFNVAKTVTLPAKKGIRYHLLSYWISLASVAGQGIKEADIYAFLGGIEKVVAALVVTDGGFQIQEFALNILTDENQPVSQQVSANSTLPNYILRYNEVQV